METSSAATALEIPHTVRAFLKRLQNTAHAYALWGPQERFIVGVSGGADSLCLLDCLFLLSAKYHFTLHVAHVNYGLRGSDADQDEALVRARARLYGLSCAIFKPKKRLSANLEESLREERYAFFERCRKQYGAGLIAIAHQADDQAETLLMRLLRGSGLRGLSAMQPKNGHIVRPLLFVKRAEILEYLKERRLGYREDQSNRDPRYLRNRIRHELVPFLEKNYQPKLSKILTETALLIGADYALLETLAAPSPGVALSRRTLMALSNAELRLRIRSLLHPYFFPKTAPQGIVNECVKVVRSRKSKSRTVVFRGLKLECKGDRVTLLKIQSGS